MNSDTIKIIITDVTEMDDSHYCIAGWDNASKRMIRPLLKKSENPNWSREVCKEYNIAEGRIISFTKLENFLPHNSYPHRTEDCYIENDITLGLNENVNWFGDNMPPLALSVAEAFNDHIKHDNKRYPNYQYLKSVYVPVNTQIHSLCGIKISNMQLKFSEEKDYQNNNQMKLRAYFNDEHEDYNMPVKSRKLNEIYREKGIKAVNEIIPNGNIHIRLGLARTSKHKPNECTVMFNGMLF